MAGPTKGANVADERRTRGGLTPGERLVAFEVRPQKAGFVVLEGGAKLLDWGVRRYGKRHDHLGVAGKKLGTLLELYSPAVVVFRRRNHLTTSTAEAVSSVLARVRAEAQRRSIKLESVSTQTVRQFFGRFGCNTKHQIATKIAERFEELAWKLPPKRKPWQSEHPSALVFDATAAAMTFLGSD